jgi:hypothetical protein
MVLDPGVPAAAIRADAKNRNGGLIRKNISVKIVGKGVIPPSAMVRKANGATGIDHMIAMVPLILASAVNVGL